ncbi:terminase large subunit [Vagococcus fessus]|uniref:Amino acid transporter n=1 Tax=Vagococcus fessus TaxID=120370 RepID=A0A430A571_9ENTE|nr:terminase TerL endonuclease subunit [Vagococcus fessus]RSU01958.1 amino acid transporter [Vagococcus fessus]
MREEYKDDAYLYCRMVIDGKIKSSVSVFKACQRHLDDLEKNDFRYVYDPEQAAKVINFMELLPDVKTGQTFPMALFQKFQISMLYGWRRKDDRSLRRFKKAFISVARKNGKSILIAGIALYEFLFGKNPAMSRQIFCTANDKKQASIVFEMVRKQLEYLRGKYSEINKATKRVREELKNLNDESYVRPLSRDTGSVDGFEPYIAILDEYAASKTTEMMELLESGQAQLENCLTIIISTAGFNLNAPMHTIEYPYAKRVLNKEVEDEEYFAYIAEQDSVEEIEDEGSWIKSNPILEVEDMREQMMTYLRKRKSESIEKGTYNSILVKNFNMWRQASEESYIASDHWLAIKNDEKEDITGRRAWIGVDVGKSSDLFSITWITKAEEHWHIDSHSFVATKYGLEVKEKRDGLDYRYLESIGECDITNLESGVIDYDFVFRWLEDFVISNRLDVQFICYDPYQFGHILTMIEKYHPEWQMFEVRQGTRTLSMPTKQFRDDVINKTIRHDGNNILTSSVNNAITMEDNNGLRINKAKNSNKIDPIDAGLNAFSVCYTEGFDDALIDDDYILSDDFGF